MTAQRLSLVCGALALALAPLADAQPAPDAGAPPDAATEPPAEDLPEGATPSESPLRATEIGALSSRQCLRALVRARVPFERVRWGSSGMATPVVITGPIAGLLVHAGRGLAPRETMDCLLAVALVRYAGFLRARGIREVRHLSLHRPATPDEVARRPLLPRHPGGLAIDAAVFVRDDGTELNVTRDFHGHLGAPVCGPTARVSTAPEARALRAIFCDAAREGLFHVALSPNFNDEHRNHFHLEIARSVSWLFVR